MLLLLINDKLEIIILPKGNICKSFEILFILFPKKLPNPFVSDGDCGIDNNDKKYELLFCLIESM